MFGKKCPHCGYENKPSAKFCNSCGQDLMSLRQAEVQGNVWFAREDEFAASLTIDDLGGFFAKRLEVLPGFQALIYQEGAFQGKAGPGEYTLDTFLGVLNRFGRHKPTRILITRDRELSLEMGFQDLPTLEYLPVDVELSLGIRVADPAPFAAGLMAKPGAFSTLDMRRLLSARLGQILAEYFRGQSIAQLGSREGLRGELDRVITRQLGQSLEEDGLAISSVQTLAVGHTQYDENNRIRAQAWLDVDRKRAELDRRLRLDQLYGEEEMARLARMESEQQIAVKIRDLQLRGEEQSFTERLRRIELLDKIRKADTRERISEIDAAQEILHLEQEARKKDLALEDERIVWAHVRQLADIKRQTEAAIAGIEQERILSEARATLKQDRAIADLKHEIERTRLMEDEASRRQRVRLEGELQLAQQQREETLRDAGHRLAVQEKELIAREREKEFDRTQAWADHELEMRVTRDKRGLEAEERAGKFEHVKKLAELDQTLDRHDQEMKNQDAARKREDDKAQQEEARRNRELEGRLEQQRIEALGQLGPEALIHLSPAEQGQIIAGLQRTKAMQNMTEEQIMAMAAENSPALAEALKERFRQMGDQGIGTRERDLYDRLAKQQETNTDRIERLHREAEQRQHETVKLVLDAMKEMHRNPPGSSAPASHIFVTPGGPALAQPLQPQGPASGPAGDAGKIMVCPSCRANNALNARFCDNCGKTLG